jgi:hypothetical protein
MAGVSHREREPQVVVKLSYDGDKKLTVAVLSQQLDGLSVYFQCRVEQGTAFQRSPLYYELDGYVRENIYRIRHLKCSGLHDTSVAVGALEESDTAQIDELLTERQKKLNGRIDNGLLEQALDICRLHRLDDDLDVMSIYFMHQASKVFRRVANKLAAKRMTDTTLVLRPFCDGVWSAGYSSFARERSTQLVQHVESGRSIEYHQADDIILSCSDAATQMFAPVDPSNATKAEIAWDCEELALANLHRWWGDIAVSEYIGQKLVLYKKLHPNHPDFQDNNCSNTVNLATLRLDAEPPKGVRTWPMLLSNITLEVLERRLIKMDDVTTKFAGRLRVTHVHLDFTNLVRATARHSINRLKKKFARIEERRPMLEHERQYLQQVRDLAAL